MTCKSCNFKLLESNKYCCNCGAKIVHDRLSLKGTIQEFIVPFFSIDNNFWRTFIDLFKNPKAVLGAYINGARKKYFQPFSYIVLFATVAVFFYKLFPMEYIMEASNEFNSGFNAANKETKAPPFDMKVYMETLMNYYNFFLLGLLPVYALTSYLVYKKYQHNFFEHLVFNSYIQANLGYVSLILQLILVSFLGLSFINYTYLFLIIFFIYTIYAFKHLYQINLKESILSGLLFILLFLALYFIVIVFFTIIFMIIYFTSFM